MLYYMAAAAMKENVCAKERAMIRKKTEPRFPLTNRDEREN
jgi:hypothetical protein